MRTENTRLKDLLIKNGVRNLHEFGYEFANKENILTDEICKEFFKSMLKDNLGHNSDVDKAINELLKQLE